MKESLSRLLKHKPVTYIVLAHHTTNTQKLTQQTAVLSILPIAIFSCNNKEEPIGYCALEPTDNNWQQQQWDHLHYKWKQSAFGFFNGKTDSPQSDQGSDRKITVAQFDLECKWLEANENIHKTTHHHSFCYFWQTCSFIQRLNCSTWNHRWEPRLEPHSTPSNKQAAHVFLSCWLAIKAVAEF